MRILKAERGCSGFCRYEFVWTAADFADPERSHEFQSGQPVQAVSVPLPQLGIFRILPDDRVLDECVAEVIDHLRNGEDAAEAFIESLLGLCGGMLRCRRENDRQPDHYPQRSND